MPAGAEVISTEGMSVLPGLWDMHVHLMIVGHADYDHWDKTYPPLFRSTIMPAAAKQLLLAGVTSARDLGAPLEDILAVRDAISRGEIPGPTLYVSGPFLQHEPYPGTEAFRWGSRGPRTPAPRCERLAEAGVDVIKLIDQDQMTMDEVRAVVDEAHERKLPVVAHSHRAEEIRRGIQAGVDCFEHTGLGTAPEYPRGRLRPDEAARPTPSTGRPTIGPLLLYQETRDDFPSASTTRAGRRACRRRWWPTSAGRSRHPDRAGLLPARAAAPARPWPRKFEQLRQSGVILLIGTDSGVPLNFHSDSTWREIDTWVSTFGVAADGRDPRRHLLARGAMKVDKEVGTVSAGQVGRHHRRARRRAAPRRAARRRGSGDQARDALQVGTRTVRAGRRPDWRTGRQGPSPPPTPPGPAAARPPSAGRCRRRSDSGCSP